MIQNWDSHVVWPNMRYIILDIYIYILCDGCRCKCRLWLPNSLRTSEHLFFCLDSWHRCPDGRANVMVFGCKLHAAISSLETAFKPASEDESSQFPCCQVLMPYILLSLKQIVRRLKEGWNMLKQYKSASKEYSCGTFALQKIGSLWDWWARWIQWHTTSTQWRLTLLAQSCSKCRYTFWTTKTFRYCRWHCLVIVVWCRSSLKFHVSGPCLINSKKT